MLQKFKISRTINERITHSIKLLRNLSKENNLVLLLDDLEDFQSSETINSFLKEIILMGINNELRPVIVSSSTSRSNELYALVKKPQFYRVEIDELLINEAKGYIFTNIGKSITDDDLKKIPFPKYVPLLREICTLLTNSPNESFAELTTKFIESKMGVLDKISSPMFVILLPLVMKKVGQVEEMQFIRFF